MIRYTKYLIVIGILVLQIGCGSSGGGGDDSNDSGDDNISDGSETETETENNPDNTGSTPHTVRLLGMVGVVERKTGGSNSPVVTANATFSQYEKSFEIPESATTPFADLLGTCEVSTDTTNDIGTIPQPAPADNTRTNNINGGTGIKITSAGEKYLDLATITIGEDSVLYGSIEDSPPMAPDLKLTIPGDGLFPAFTDVPMTTVGPINFDSPSNNTIRFDTKFSWQAGGNPDVFVLLSASAFRTTVECITQDTGNFEFPEETQNELGTGFFGNKLEAARLAYDMQFKDEAALIVFSMSVAD